MAKLIHSEFYDNIIDEGFGVDTYIEGFIEIEEEEGDLDDLLGDVPNSSIKDCAIYLLDERLRGKDGDRFNKERMKSGYIGTDNISVLDWDVTKIGKIYKLIPSEQGNT